MKLDKTDKKLFLYLYHHYREPLTKIAKACRISREQAEYRIRKYEKEGIIRKYLTIFNYNFLGYNEFVIVWLKLSKENKEAIKKELESMKNVISVGDVIACYDLFINFVFKDKSEFESVFCEFIEKHKKIISDYSIFITTYAEFFPLKFFGHLKEERLYEFVKPAKAMQIDEKDLDILKILEKNGRTRIIEIAKQANLSSGLILYKLKQLYKNKIILGTRIQFDMEKFGFYFGNLKIKLKNKTEKLKERIKIFCKNHEQINALVFGISEYNCIIQVFYQEEKEFRQTIKDFNETFKEEIEKSQILLIEKEGECKTLPY